jgi:hypothetical protein
MVPTRSVEEISFTMAKKQASAPGSERFPTLVCPSPIKPACFMSLVEKSLDPYVHIFSMDEEQSEVDFEFEAACQELRQINRTRTC